LEITTSQCWFYVVKPHLERLRHLGVNELPVPVGVKNFELDFSCEFFTLLCVLELHTIGHTQLIQLVNGPIGIFTCGKLIWKQMHACWDCLLYIQSILRIASSMTLKAIDS